MWNTNLPFAAKATFLAFVSLFTTLISFSQPDVQYQPFIGSGENLSAPMEVVTAPGDVSGRLFIVEKAGRIRIWDGSQVLGTSFLDITSIVIDDGEHGLLSMTFHPDYQTNGFFFVYYNNNAGNITVARYKVSADPNVADPVADPPVQLISIPKNYSNHNGGHLQFKTESGIPYLYFATGDGGSANDPDRNAQDPASFLGKMIRINVDVTPFVPEIWAWGLRNPFRWSFDRNTGDIWIGDVGQDSREEINFSAGGVFGVNYGWPCVEGTQNNPAGTSGSRCDTVVNLDDLPVYDYDNPTEGASVIGGHVYRGAEFPGLQGYYLATDFYSGRLWLIKPQSPGPGWDISVKTGMATGISSISETNDGTLYAVSLNTGAIFKIVIPIVTPVELLSFSGKSFTGFNELQWVAVSEQNIDRYTVEFSKDGRAFSKAGEVRSLNNGNRNSYSYRHVGVDPGNIYYRLRMSESDGSFKYSAVIQLGGAAVKGIRVYPTIITNNSVNIVSGEAIQEIRLVNSEGRQVWSIQMNGAQGFFSVQLPTLPKGVYLMRLETRDRVQAEKIIIQ